MQGIGSVARQQRMIWSSEFVGNILYLFRGCRGLSGGSCAGCAGLCRKLVNAVGRLRLGKYFG